MGTIESIPYKNKDFDIMKKKHIHKLRKEKEHNNNSYSYSNINKTWWEWLRN